MHAKALDLLKQYVFLYRIQSDRRILRIGQTQRESMKDKPDPPGIEYSRKLGPEYIHQVFNYARWIFDER
jgi:hypothetical protein